MYIYIYTCIFTRTCVYAHGWPNSPPSKVLILLALLVSWLDCSPDVQYEFLDYFAGKARLAQLAEARGFRAEAFDKTFGDLRAKKRGKRSSMDINSNAGMVKLGWCTASLHFDASCHGFLV